MEYNIYIRCVYSQTYDVTADLMNRAPIRMPLNSDLYSRATGKLTQTAPATARHGTNSTQQLRTATSRGVVGKTTPTFLPVVAPIRRTMLDATKKQGSPELTPACILHAILLYLLFI